MKNFAMARALIFCTLLSAFFAPAIASSPFQNMDEWLQPLGVQPYYDLDSSPSHKVKIAIFDNGFKDFYREIGRSLPKDLIYSPQLKKTPGDDPHGTVMAQIVTAVLTQNGRTHSIPFELHLYSTVGYTQFEAATTDAIQKKIDVILYSQFWDYGSNFDGKGFFNAVINRATKAGILWVGSVGNLGNATYQTAIRKTADNMVVLPGPDNSVRFWCLESVVNTQTKKCRVRAVLSWDDFKEDVKKGTSKDLDFILTDSFLNSVKVKGPQGQLIPAVSALQQTEDPKLYDLPGYSRLPREIIEAEVAPGLYYLRAKMRSSQFSAKDTLRITVQGASTQLLDHTDAETVPTGPDNASVISVGASDSVQSSKSAKLNKPELVYPSEAEVTQTDRYRGSSNSAAMVAGAVAILKSYLPGLTRAQLLKLAKQSSSSTQIPVGEGLPLEYLGFYPTGPGCFVPTRAPLHRTLQGVLEDGGTAVLTTRGIKIFSLKDPLYYAQDAVPERYQINDMIVANGRTFEIFARVSDGQLSPDRYEVVQIPQGQSICGQQNKNAKARPSTYRLPDPETLGL